MLIPGLCSVTFRHLSPERIIELVSQAGLTAIEWGGDVHVPDPETAREVARMCADAGVAPVSYGSYFRAGTGQLETFERTLETALNLGASNIRVWAGDRGSAETSPGQRAVIIEELRDCGELALSAGLTLSLEFHGGTLTDSNESVGRLITQLGASNVHLYWQPRWDLTEDERLGGLMLAMQRLTHIHLFTWDHSGRDVVRLPLDAGRDFLLPALTLAKQDGNDHCVFLEFVQDSDEGAFLRDAEAVKGMVGEAMGK